MIRHWAHERVYKRHGQTTIVRRIKMYNIFLVDCGAVVYRRIKDVFECVTYDSMGYGITHRYLTRDNFIKEIKRILKRLTRIK